MSGDFDPREYDTRERHDGIHDRKDEWLVIGPDHDLAAPRDESNDHDAREAWRPSGSRRSTQRRSQGSSWRRSVSAPPAGIYSTQRGRSPTKLARR